MHEIRLINDSVAYTPFQGPKQPGSVKARGTEEPSVISSTAILQTQAAACDGPEEVNAFNASQKGLSTVPLAVQTQSSGPKVSQTREHSVQGPNGIDLLHSNINRLEKLERRLMRGERHGNRKRSQAVEQAEHENEATFGKETKRKGKKERKNWRFAYDLYCKEIISGS